jgi:hypothetical protein
MMRSFLRTAASLRTDDFVREFSSNQVHHACMKIKASFKRKFCRLGAFFELRWLFGAMVCCNLMCIAQESLAANNDGKTDIFWRNGSTNAVWVMDGVSYSSSISLPSLSDLNWKMVGSADLNHDGQIDLLWRHATNGVNAVWFLSGSTFLSAAYIQPLSDTNWVIVATGYFGGANDKSPDLLWRHEVTGDNAIWHLDGTTLVSTQLIQEVPDLNWKIVGTGDFNGDGHTDILWRHSIGLNGVWYMQGGTYVTSGWLQSESDSNWQIVGTGYFSGTNDNTIDLLWRYSTNGDNAIWQLSGISIASTHTVTSAPVGWNVGGTGDSKVDADGDGLADLWEKAYFGDLTATANGDPDNDSRTNSEEYQDGTDPIISGGDPRIREAVDNEILNWVQGGNANWSNQTSEYHADHDAAQSGSVSDSQTSYIETTLVGPGTVYFWSKVSSEYAGDYLKVFRDGTEIYSASGEVDWQEHEFSLTAGTYVIRFSYIKNSSSNSGSDAAWIDLIRFEKGYDYSPSSLEDAVDSTGLNWSTAGDNNWWAQGRTQAVYGGDNGRAGSINDDQETYISTSVTGPGYLTFYWQTDSEEGGDFLRFKADWTLIESISGHTPWLFRSYYITAGSHTLSWHYTKDSSVREGWDTAYLDRVLFASDSDRDGLPDDWETTYFGNTSSQSGVSDYDGDGFSNLQEYLNSTGPTSAELQLKVSTPRQNSYLP